MEADSEIEESLENAALVALRQRYETLRDDKKRQHVRLQEAHNMAEIAQQKIEEAENGMRAITDAFTILEHKS